MAPPARGGIPPNSPLLNPNAQLSGQALYDAAKALADAQTQGPMTELARQIAMNSRQGAGAQHQTAGYFNQLGQYGLAGVGQQRQIGDALNSQLKGIEGDTASRLGQSELGNVSNFLAHTPGGAQGPGMQSLAQGIARQQGLAAQGQGAFRSFGATQGANYSGLSAANLGSYAMRGQEALGDIGRATRLENEPLNAKIAALQAQHGALLTTDLGRLRQQEIANKFTSQGLNLKGQQIQASAAQNAAQNALALTRIEQQQMQSDRTFRLDKQKFGAAAAKDAYLRAHGLGPYRPPKGSTGPALPKFTPTGTPTLSTFEQQRSFGQIDSLQQIVRDMQQPLSNSAAKHFGVAPGTKLSGSQIRAFLANGSATGTKYNPALVDAAFALVGWGFLTPFQITELNKLGLIVGNRYRRGNAPKPSTGGVGGGLGGLGGAF